MYVPNVADEGVFPVESACVSAAFPLAFELQIVGTMRRRAVE